jgi:hypothetical protein
MMGGVRLEPDLACVIDNRRMQIATFRNMASCAATAALMLFIAPLHAQTRLTADDYSRAEQLLGYNTNRLVLHLAAQPTWVGDDRLWYRATTENGTEFFEVDAATGARTPAFDQAKVAAALSSAARSSYSRTDCRSTSSNSAATASPFRSTPAEASGHAMWQVRDATARSDLRDRRSSSRRTANVPPSSAITTSGCATPRPARKRS